MRDWCSGNMFDSKPNDVGSIPTSRAKKISKLKKRTSSKRPFKFLAF